MALIWRKNGVIVVFSPFFFILKLYGVIITENTIEKDKITRVILVSVFLKDDDAQETEDSLDELERLAVTAGAEVFCRMTQAKETPDPRTYIGSGKVSELKELCKNNDVDTVVFDCELSPSQIKNLEDDGGNIRVIDRSMLILDIFALHAVSGEGKLQVELAQLKYTVPRLMGHGTELSRLGGGIGTRGPGESKLETDRRHVNRRIDALKAQLSELEKNRAVMRVSRERSGIFRIAVVGYTNAGKSTLLNALTDAGILAEDKLFATLDTTTRKYTLPSGTDILLTDTVGFIRNLPHHLIEAFKSTLDEIKYSDALIIVSDVHDKNRKKQLEVTEKLINELGAGKLPVIFVYNKCDLGIVEKPDTSGENVFISAKTKDGFDKLLFALERTVNGGKETKRFFFPSEKLGDMNRLYGISSVQSAEYTDNGAFVTATVDKKTAGMFEKYIV